MTRLALFAAFTLLALVASTAMAQSQSIEVMDARLPEGTEGPAAAAHGGMVYIFGGYHGSHTEIVNGAEVQMHERSEKIWRYDPATDALNEMTAKMPTPRHWALARTVGDVIYVFGGFGCNEDGNRCQSILKYEPSADRITSLEGDLSRFPVGYYFMAGAAFGQSIYIAGGESVTGRFDEIWQFNVTTETLRLFEDKFPASIAAMSAEAVGPYLYFFGGQDANSQIHRTIWKFDPSTEEFEAMPAKLPRKAYSMSSATDGNLIYLFGGQDYPHELDSVVRFDPSTKAVSLLQAKLPAPRFRTAAAWVGDAAYIVGGSIQDHENEANTQRLDEIVRFGPSTDGVEPTQEFADPDGGGGIPAPGFMAAALALLGLVLFGRRR